MQKTLALLATLFFAACSGRTAPLPPGTYNYTSTEGSVTLKSTVTVSRETDSTVFREQARLSVGDPIIIETRLDSNSYSIVGFSVENDSSQDDQLLKIGPSSATYLPKSGKSTVVNAPVQGAPAWVFAEWASTYLAIPAMVHATGAKTLNVYYPTTFQIHGKTLAQTLVTVPVSGARPRDVPAADSALGLAWHDAEKPVVTLWYDPSTYVVDAVYLGTSPTFTRDR